MLHYRLCFLQCDWWREISLQKVINVNEARGISQISPDPFLSLVGSGHESMGIRLQKQCSDDYPLKCYQCSESLQVAELWLESDNIHVLLVCNVV